MINKIKLENWKSHYRSEFSFSKGTNVIVGVMGSGKTSIMDAICFSLYGTFPSLNARKISLEETISSKPNKADFAKVKLEFDYNGKNYVVERTVKRKGATEAVLYEEGKLINGPKPKDVNERIESILGVGYELFALAVYSEQNDIDHFLKLSASERKRKFDELLQLHKYERARANAVSVANVLKKTVEERQRQLNELKAGFSESELLNAKERLEKIANEAKAKKEKIVELEKEIEAESKKLYLQEELLKKVQTLKKNIEFSEAKKSMHIRRIEELKKEIEEISKKVDAEKVRKEIEDVKKEAENLERLEKELNSRLSSISKRIGETTAAIKASEEAIQGLRKAKARCPVCSRPLDEHSKKQIEEENIRLIVEKEREEKTLVAEQKKVEGEIYKIRLEMRNKNNKLNELLKAVGEAESILEKQNKIILVEKEIKKEEEEKQRLQKELSCIEVDEKGISLLREKISSLREKKAGYKEQVDSAMSLSKEIAKSIELMEKRKKLVEDNELFIAKANEKLGKMKIFANALIATQAELRDCLVGAINEAMNDVWERVYPYKDYTSAKIFIEGSNYEVKVRERSGSWVNAEGMLSGGERSSVALTLRIAIALVLTRNLGWIILDEPTHNLDTNAVSALAGMLKSHLPELVDQIFIITHDKQMENAASANLYLLARDKERDEPTRVEVL